MAFPVQNVGVSLTALTLGSATPLSALSSCVTEGVARALRDAHVQVSHLNVENLKLGQSVACLLK